MRVLLINPPSPAGQTINREGSAGLGNRYERAGAFLYPPQMLATAATVLRQAGHTPWLLDATAEEWDTPATLERLTHTDADVLVMQWSWSGWVEDLAFAGALRAACPGAALIGVGVILRQPAWAEAAAECCDLVLLGEPELALPVACEQVLAGARGIRWAHELAPREYDEQSYLLNLAGLPFPAWDLTPRDRYGMLTVLSARGCEAGCAYCPYVVGWGRRFRACPPARVAEELAWLQRQFAPPRILFRDPVFASDRTRVVGICQELGKRRLRVSWECESRPEHFEPGLLALMQRSGCVAVKIGVETADEGQLLRTGRVHDQAEAHAYLGAVTDTLTACRRLGMRCQLFLMAGWPAETGGQAACEHTAAFLRRLGPEYVTVKAITPYPGTRWEAAGLAERTDEATACMEMLSAEAVPAKPARRPLWRRGLGKLRRVLGR